MNVFKILLLSIILNGCYYDKPFDKEIWLKNNSIEHMSNPRARMTNDLENNILKNGMNKSEILNLLGQPFEDAIEYRIPKGMKIPDSISFANCVGKSKKETQIALDRYNSWYKLNSQPDTILLYPVEWSLIDPYFLVIKFNGNNSVRDFWVEQR